MSGFGILPMILLVHFPMVPFITNSTKGTQRTLLAARGASGKRDCTIGKIVGTIGIVSKASCINGTIG